MPLSRAQRARNTLAAAIRSNADPDIIELAREQLTAAVLEAKVRRVADLPLTDRERIHAARLILAGPQ
jgi:hypothetical protein